MKVKLDENIPFRLVSDLAAFGHDVDTVASEGLKGKPDSEVWVAAPNKSRRCSRAHGNSPPIG